jgi:hypothetical protein
MGIVSEPWGEGKGLVATNYRDTGGDRGWTEGQGRQSEAPAGRRRPEGTHATEGRGQGEEPRSGGAGVQRGGGAGGKPATGDTGNRGNGETGRRGKRNKSGETGMGERRNGATGSRRGREGARGPRKKVTVPGGIPTSVCRLARRSGRRQGRGGGGPRGFQRIWRTNPLGASTQGGQQGALAGQAMRPLLSEALNPGKN